MRQRQDLLDADSPADLEVFQLTDEPGLTGAHIYMEAPVFSPDGRLMVLERNGNAHDQTPNDPQHRYMVCDLEDGYKLSPLTHELNANALAVAPDGWVYYLVDESIPGGGRVLFRRVKLDGTERSTLMVIDSDLPGTRFRPSRIYPLGTISSDSSKYAAVAYMGDGKTPNGPWGLMVFDLARNSVAVVIHGQTYCNLHPQFCRSTDPDARRWIMIQENHGCDHDAVGKCQRLVGGLGADIHLIRDDGQPLGDFPWGRVDGEHCQGHQCWRGTSTWAINGTVEPHQVFNLIESQAVPGADHAGAKTPGGIRNIMSRSFAEPHFEHFATDRSGQRLITDCGPVGKGGKLYLADLGRPGVDALSNWTYLLNAHCRAGSDNHLHPFLSLDGTLAFFNSNESGRLQAYMIQNIPNSR